MEKIRGKINYCYDKEVDVLYSYINKPRPASSKELNNGVVLRYDPKSNKLVGFTIIDFKKRIKNGLLKSIPSFPEVNVSSLLKLSR